MGNYNNTLDVSEFPTMPDSKQFDLYLTDDCETACSGNKCIGHANYETKNWYGDYYFPVTETYPWVDRGGSTSDRTAAGIFSMSYYNGKDMGSISFRLTFLLGV